MATKRKSSMSAEIPKRCLYVGTTEYLAKEAPLKGLRPTVILTDVYAGYFASRNNTGKWGIVEVDLDELILANMMPVKKYKDWEESLRHYGVCNYPLHVPSSAVLKVTIYNPNGRDFNQFVNKNAVATNPLNMSLSAHQSNYQLNSRLSRWLSCQSIENMSDSLRNQAALEMYYRK